MFGTFGRSETTSRDKAQAPRDQCKGRVTKNKKIVPTAFEWNLGVLKNQHKSTLLSKKINRFQYFSKRTCRIIIQQQLKLRVWYTGVCCFLPCQLEIFFSFCFQYKRQKIHITFKLPKTPEPRTKSLILEEPVLENFVTKKLSVKIATLCSKYLRSLKLYRNICPKNIDFQIVRNCCNIKLCRRKT